MYQLKNCRKVTESWPKLGFDEKWSRNATWRNDHTRMHLFIKEFDMKVKGTHVTATKKHGSESYASISFPRRKMGGLSGSVAPISFPPLHVQNFFRPKLDSEKIYREAQNDSKFWPENGFIMLRKFNFSIIS